MTDFSPYATVGAKLIERGYCAIPAAPGTKAPGMVVGGHWVKMTDWTRRYLSRLPSERETDTWSNVAGGGVCLVTGRASGGVVAIDADTEDAAEAMRRALPYTPARKRGQKGETSFYRGEIESKPLSRKLPDGRSERLVDILSEGRQTVLPPSIHPETGKPYIWIGEAALEDIAIEDLPELPANALEMIVAALKPLGYVAEVDRKAIAGRAPAGDDKTPFRLLNEHALANLDAWIPKLPLYRLRKTPAGWEAVADWRASCTGKPLDKRKLNLKITPGGIKDFGADHGYTAIDLVTACNFCSDPNRAFEWLAEITRWGSDTFHDPKPRATIEFGGVMADAETGEIIEAPAPTIFHDPKPRARKDDKPKTSRRPPWLDGIDPARCPGLVGKIADWIVATADFQQPLLAMGAALSIVGTVAGRQLCGPTKSGTHLYTIGVASTGGGKDHPLKSIGRILSAAELKCLIGGGKFTSETSVVNTVLNSPACVCAIDEFGAFLARGKNRQASTHEQGISSMLRTLWGSSGDIVPTTERAGERFKLLYSPAMTIFGTSTAEEFYDAISDQDTRNGLLNRFLILENPKRPPRTKPDADKDEVPAEIIDGLKKIYWRLGHLGASTYHGAGDIELKARPVMVPWRDEFAELAFDELQESTTKRMDAEPEHERYLVRTAEMAVRLATIRAIGIDPHDPRVTEEDMNWGAALALRSVDAMIEGATDNIAENFWEANVNKVVNSAKKRKVCKIRDFQTDTKLRSKDIMEIVNDLIEMGRLRKKDVTDRRSETKTVYAYEFIK
jgi:hypothetical protein